MKKYLIEDLVTFDVHHMTLRGTSRLIELTANESELLEMLLDGLSTKSAIIHRVWGSKGLIVTDSSYHQLVRSVRSRLEESGVSGSLIKTLPRQGLKFMGIVRPLPSESATPFASLQQLDKIRPASLTTASRSAEPIHALADSVPTPAPAIARAVATWPRHKAIRRVERLILLGVFIWASLVTWQMASMTDRLPWATGQMKQSTQ
jgi:cholera toxin transcriptional activator